MSTGEVRFKQVELKDLAHRTEPEEQVSSRFRMQRINDFYYGWSATAADINHDGILDIVSGPFYYLGPDYKVSREIYFSKTSDVSSQLTPAMVNFAYDYTGDGWPDVLIASGRPMSLYVNPKGEARRWDKYNVLPTINSEVAVFKDIDGDGKPDVIFVGGGTVELGRRQSGGPYCAMDRSRGISTGLYDGRAAWSGRRKISTEMGA